MGLFMLFWAIVIAILLYGLYRLFLRSFFRVAKQADQLKINRLVVRKMISHLDRDVAEEFLKKLDPKQSGPDLVLLAHLVYYSNLLSGNAFSIQWLQDHFESLGISIRKDVEMIRFMLYAFGRHEYGPEQVIDLINKIETYYSNLFNQNNE
jgi:hypothetical protein